MLEKLENLSNVWGLWGWQVCMDFYSLIKRGCVLVVKKMSFALKKRTVNVHLGSLHETSQRILHADSVLNVQISYIYWCTNNNSNKYYLNNSISHLSFLFNKSYMLYSEIADIKYSGHVSSFIYYIFFSSVFWDRVLHCFAWPHTHCTDWGWIWTSDPLTSTFRVLGLQACSTRPSVQGRLTFVSSRCGSTRL